MFKIATAFALLINSIVFGQIGIKTTIPNVDADLDLGSANKALYLNRVANPTSDIANPQSGMVLYDTTMKCIRVYQGNPPVWSACLKEASQTTLKLASKDNFSKRTTKIQVDTPAKKDR